MGRFCSWRLVFFGDKSRLVSRLFFGEKIGIIALSPTFGEAISGETISGSKTNRSKSDADKPGANVYFVDTLIHVNNIPEDRVMQCKKLACCASPPSPSIRE